MKLHNLTPAKGATKPRKRIARGQGSGKGGTATRGHKGAQSRSGYSKKFGFEGGQMPLQRRIPKYGFKSRNKLIYRVLNLDTLQAFADSEQKNHLTLELMVSSGLVDISDKVKILGGGELNSSLEVQAHAASESAKKAFEEKGGKIELI